MARLPRPGRTKTRLARGIGTVAAARWARRTTATLLHRLDDPRWTLWLAVAPDTALHSPVWPAHLPRLVQGPGDLGARMGRLLRRLPPGPAVILGSDIPGADAPHVARAFAALGRADAVLGPAPDGGYWLVGLRRTAAVPARLFAGVRWSTGHAAADTLATLPARTALVDTLADVDTAEDLARAPASSCLKYRRRRRSRRLSHGGAC